MAHIILTGATGLVGSAALVQLLSLPTSTVARLSILSRRPVALAEGKPNVTVIQHDDFTSYPPELLEQLKGASGCIWALGISVTQVDKKVYNQITIDYALAAAKAFSTLSDEFKFVYISGEGATTSPGFLTPYFGKIKGQAEIELLKLPETYPSLKPYSLRPAMVDPKGHAEIQPAIQGRKTSAVMSALEAVAGPAIRALSPGSVSPTKPLGEFMINLATGDGRPLKAKDGDVEMDGRIVNNKAFRRIMGL